MHSYEHISEYIYQINASVNKMADKTVMYAKQLEYEQSKNVSSKKCTVTKIKNIYIYV